MPSMNVSLTPELMQLVQQKVASGMYNNASEVVREALRTQDSNAALLQELKLAKLRETLAPGLQDAATGNYADYSHEQLLQELDKNS